MAANINKDFEEEKHDQSSLISMSAFSKASHRLRSMSLVSGYLLAQKGSLYSLISVQKSHQEKDLRWVPVFNGNAELNVLYHPKYK